MLDRMIAQVRKSCAPLAGRVAGAADFAQGLKNYNATMPLPAGYVIPLTQTSDGNENMIGMWAPVQKVMGVVVEFDATPDRRGQVPAMAYDEIETGLFHALLNWKPDACSMAYGKGMYFVGGHFLDLDRARVFYQWEFAVDWLLTDEDGATLEDRDPTATDLNSIEVDLYKYPEQWPPNDAVAPPVIIKLIEMAANWDADGV